MVDAAMATLRVDVQTRHNQMDWSCRQTPLSMPMLSVGVLRPVGIIARKYLFEKRTRSKYRFKSP